MDSSVKLLQIKITVMAYTRAICNFYKFEVKTKLSHGDSAIPTFHPTREI